MKYFLFVFLPFFAFGQVSSNAKVFAVHDGDSYKILIDGQTTKKWIRVYGVDCPEVISNKISEDQPYGRAVADSVRSMIKGKRIQVDSFTTDKFNRTVAKVRFEGVPMSEYLLSKGWAWFLKDDYMPESEQHWYLFLQNSARDTKRGFWGLSVANVTPYEWRIRNKR